MYCSGNGFDSNVLSDFRRDSAMAGYKDEVYAMAKEYVYTIFWGFPA